MKFRRVLVTGASGMLGTAIVQRLKGETDVLPLAHQHVLPGTTALDLTQPAALADLAQAEWDAVVHCAAFRSPDFCEQEQAAARLLNAVVPARLAELAAARGARMIHISTDYVFPGTQPPYREADPCDPVNYYGQTKWEAEQAVARLHPGATILRIGALYGEPPAPLVSPLLEEALAAVYADRAVELDDRTVRFPSHTNDIAEVIHFLLNTECAGVLHASAGTPVTRYRWTSSIADILGVKARLVPATWDLSRPARRPINPMLDVHKLRSMGGPVPRPCERVLPEVLARRPPAAAKHAI